MGQCGGLLQLSKLGTVLASAFDLSAHWAQAMLSDPQHCPPPQQHPQAWPPCPLLITKVNRRSREACPCQLVQPPLPLRLAARQLRRPAAGGAAPCTAGLLRHRIVQHDCAVLHFQADSCLGIKGPRVGGHQLLQQGRHHLGYSEKGVGGGGEASSPHPSQLPLISTFIPGSSWLVQLLPTARSRQRHLDAARPARAHLGAGLCSRQLQRLCCWSRSNRLIQLVVDGVGRLLLPLPLLLTASCPPAASAATPPGAAASAACAAGLLQRRGAAGSSGLVWWT